MSFQITHIQCGDAPKCGCCVTFLKDDTHVLNTDTGVHLCRSCVEKAACMFYMLRDERGEIEPRDLGDVGRHRVTLYVRPV